jgi:hypothetical protein
VDAEDLYGLPLDRFVAQRAALAKALRADGKRDEAKTVAALRKPSVAAWAVNQLVRSQAKAFERLLAAGDELVDVQAGVLAGDRDPTELREAVASQRVAVEQLLEAAGGLLSSEGHELSPAVLDRVADTLRAAALDPDAREQVQGARLERELRHVGLGAGGLAAAPDQSQAKSLPQTRTKSPPKSRAKSTAASRPKSAKPGRAEPERAEPERAEATPAEAKRAKPGRAEATPAEAKRGKPGRAKPKPAEPAPSRADARQAERDHQEARRTARHTEADSRRAAERAQRALEVAQERRDKAAEALAEADRAVAEAELTAQRTADAHREAQQAFEAF